MAPDTYVLYRNFMKPSLLSVLGSLNAAVAIMAGAFGAHGLKAILSAERLDVFKTASYYHLVHAVALVVYGLYKTTVKTPGKNTIAAGLLFLLGIILFSGSLYAYSLSGIGKFGMITPFGGLSFITGWILFALEIYKGSRNG